MSPASLLGSLPGQCSLCRGWTRGALCNACREALIRPVPRCERCAIAVPAGTAVCGACLIEPPPFARCSAALDYVEPWGALIRQFKFHERVELAPVFAGLMQEAGAGMERAGLLLPAPLSASRLRERGYNQSWELARRLGPTADAGLLLRVRDTAHQVDLPPAQRAANVRGAFAVEPLRRREVEGREITVVDDVLTTGATAAEMARTLLAAGAARVQLWVLARTPAPGGA
ncbi:MAG: ComF family protein [Piscinibacter sp.]